MQETDNPDLRDRAYVYWRLLSTDPEAAKEVVLAEKPNIDDSSSQMEPALLESLLKNLSSLSSVYHKPPDVSISFFLCARLNDLEFPLSPHIVHHITIPATSRCTSAIKRQAFVLIRSPSQSLRACLWARRVFLPCSLNNSVSHLVFGFLAGTLKANELSFTAATIYMPGCNDVCGSLSLVLLSVLSDSCRHL